MPFSSSPSKPLYAAAWAPLSNTVSMAPEATAGAKLGWKPTPSVPATQCGGQECSKSGAGEKWSPGSMWWSRVATTYR